MSLSLNKQGKDDLFEYGLPLFGVVFLSILVFITTTGIASIDLQRSYEYYGAELEIYMQRALVDCFAYDAGGRPVLGIIDQEKLQAEIIEKCLKHPALGIRITAGKLTVDNEYYRLHALSCGVEKKPYSCARKELRLLLRNDEGMQNEDVIIQGVLAHA